MKHHFWYSAKQLNYLAIMKEEAPEVYERYMELVRRFPEETRDHINTVEIDGKEVVYTEMRSDGIAKPSGSWDDYMYLGGMDDEPKIRMYRMSATQTHATQ
jgi:hypothetical protein